MPNLNEITADGATKINIADFKTEQLKFNLAGASNVTGSIYAKELVLKAAGATKIEFNGDVQDGTISVTGASKINGKDLVFNNLKVLCSGASKITANVTEELNIELNGASKFEYYGQPKTINQEINGVGKIKQL